MIIVVFVLVCLSLTIFVSGDGESDVSLKRMILDLVDGGANGETGASESAPDDRRLARDRRRQGRAATKTDDPSINGEGGKNQINDSHDGHENDAGQKTMDSSSAPDSVSAGARGRDDGTSSSNGDAAKALADATNQRPGGRNLGRDPAAGGGSAAARQINYDDGTASGEAAHERPGAGGSLDRFALWDKVVANGRQERESPQTSNLLLALIGNRTEPLLATVQRPMVVPDLADVADKHDPAVAARLALRESNPVHVVMTSSLRTWPGMFSAIYSALVHASDPYRLRFWLVVEPAEVEELRYWIECFESIAVQWGGRKFVHKGGINIKTFDGNRIWSSGGRSAAEAAQAKRLRAVHNYIRFYFAEFLPDLDKIIYIDTDVVVKADLAEAWDRFLLPGDDVHIMAAARPDGLYLNKQEFAQTTDRILATYMNVSKEPFQRWLDWLPHQDAPVEADIEYTIDALGRFPAFNAGVWMARLDLWRRYTVVDLFEWWMNEKAKDPMLYGLGTQPPQLLVAYGRVQWMEPEWNTLIGKNCQYLDSHKKEVFVRKGRWQSDCPAGDEGPDILLPRIARAKILHWSARVKPWEDQLHNSDVHFLFAPYEVNFQRCWFQRYIQHADPAKGTLPRDTANLRRKTSVLTKMLVREQELRKYCTHSKTWLQCDSMGALAGLETLAFGTHKMTSVALYHDRYVAVAEPNFFSGPALVPFRQHPLGDRLRRQLRAYFFAERTVHLRLAQSALFDHYVPQFYGGCYSEGERRLANVYEYLQNYALVAFASSVGLGARLRAAAAAIELVEFYRNYYVGLLHTEGGDHQDPAFAGFAAGDEPTSHQQPENANEKTPSSSDGNSKAAGAADDSSNDADLLDDFDLSDLWDKGRDDPTKPVTRTGPVIAMNMDPDHFGIAVDGTVKLAAVTAPVAPYDSRYGGDVPCTTDADCHQFFWGSDADTKGSAARANPAARTHQTLWRLRRGAPDEFGCNTERGRCVGLDHRTNLYAICRLLAEPMLRLWFDARGGWTVSETGVKARTLLYQCLSPKPQDRPHASALAEELRSMVPLEEINVPLPVLAASPALVAEALHRYDELLGLSPLESNRPDAQVPDPTSLRSFLQSYPYSLHYRNTHREFPSSGGSLLAASAHAASKSGQSALSPNVVAGGGAAAAVARSDGSQDKSVADTLLENHHTSDQQPLSNAAAVPSNEKLLDLPPKPGATMNPQLSSAHSIPIQRISSLLLVCCCWFAFFL